MRLIFLGCIFYCLTACASEPIYHASTDFLENARLMAADRGIPVWEMFGGDELYRDREGESFKEVYIYSEPQKTQERLCKAEVFQFQAYESHNKLKWILADHDNKGYTSIVAAASEKPITSCSRLPLDKYFSAHYPIEDATLIALYSNLFRLLKSGDVENIDRNDFKIISIDLWENLGLISSYRYSARVQTGSPKIYYTVEAKLQSAEFMYEFFLAGG